MSKKTYIVESYDPATRGVKADEMCAALEQIPAGDTVLLHVCCHNPTGADPDAAAWPFRSGARIA